ncbi:hypothetical protein ACFW5W_07070 [Streptomyces sp. NPDC058783]|uniref:hypothetical protein n=1 Tax=Streptomyces sp. NPDC058783 TaxID=3346633 RepID=UPI00369E8D60
MTTQPEPSAVVTLTPTDDPDEVQLTAESRGMNPARVAYSLRLTADEFDRRARAQGNAPIPYPFSPSTALLNAANAAVPAFTRALAGQPAEARRYWLAVDVPADDLDTDLPDALAYAADRVAAVLQEERGYNATAWHATEQHDAERAELIAQRDRIANDTAQALAEPTAPRTEREHWQAIADALNAANRAGMPVGIDLDGTLTDHRMWSVVWLTTEQRWTVAGWEDNDQAPAAPAQQTAPRILTDDEYAAAYVTASRNRGTIDDTLTAAFAAVGILLPPPPIEPGTCPAQFAAPDGEWHQCADDLDHDPTDGHDNGEWTWDDGQQYATPAPTEAQQ